MGDRRQFNPVQQYRVLSVMLVQHNAASIAQTNNAVNCLAGFFSENVVI
jgi:hypothetical protein